MTKNFTGKSIIDLPDNFCIIQIETTDLNPNTDTITQIAAERYRNNKLNNAFMWYSGKTKLSIALSRLKDFIYKDTIVVNRGAFFCPFIGNAYFNNLNEAFSNNIVDIQRLFKSIENQDNAKLNKMIKYYKLSTPHNLVASDDIESVRTIYFNLKKSFNEKFTNIKQITPKGNFTLKDIPGDPNKNDKNNPFYAKHVSATGELNIYTRKELGQTINNIGGTFQLNPGAKTNYLVVGKLHNTSSRKLEKAKTLSNITILDENQFLEMILGYKWL